LVKDVLAAVTIPVKVMIRPRQGNFQYTDRELLKMTGSIYAMKDLGVFGVVLGILNKYKLVDSVNTASLAEIAKPLNVTFHKAIDYTSDIIENVKVLNDITSVDAILTSGGKATAMHGKSVINELHNKHGSRLEIIAAGKITSAEIESHKKELSTRSLHGRRIVER
jgi:copper homeostasis protein